MKEKLFDFVEQKCPNAIPLLIVIRGSHAYGTNISTSDTDYAGIYIQSMNDILSNNYLPQINDDKNDIVLYELGRFIQLLSTNNPNILELLNTPEDCIIYKNSVLDDLFLYKDRFITKQSYKSFAGYATQQIKKAKGQDKKINWEKERVTRKTPIDFCSLIKNGKSYELKKYIKDQNLYGLVRVNHTNEVYALYYDYITHFLNKLKFPEIIIHLFSLKFRGIEGENSNQLKTSSVPKNIPKFFFKGYISYNKDGYSTHCSDYNEYQDFLNNRNEQRWIDVKNHDQKIDGKNMMHCIRLLEMSREMAQGEGVQVRRNDAKELLKIRRGEVNLEALIDKAENIIVEIKLLFENSNLPKEVDKIFINKILYQIRKKIYNIN